MPHSEALTSVASHYNQNAERLARAYLNVAFGDVHSGWIRHLPPPGAAILDVGAGAGRDALALAQRGYRVTAVEPSASLRKIGEQAVRPHVVAWIDDELPALSRIRQSDIVYDFVLCSAVIMHVRTSCLRQTMQSLAAVIRSRGYVALTLRKARPTDPPGVFHDHSSEDLTNAAALAGFELVDKGDNADVLGRDEVIWSWFIFRAA